MKQRSFSAFGLHAPLFLRLCNLYSAFYTCYQMSHLLLLWRSSEVPSDMSEANLKCCGRKICLTSIDKRVNRMMYRIGPSLMCAALMRVFDAEIAMAGTGSLFSSMSSGIMRMWYINVPNLEHASFTEPRRPYSSRPLCPQSQPP